MELLVLVLSTFKAQNILYLRSKGQNIGSVVISTS